jgi:hypothetical protein
MRFLRLSSYNLSPWGSDFAYLEVRGSRSLVHFGQGSFSGNNGSSWTIIPYLCLSCSDLQPLFARSNPPTFHFRKNTSDWKDTRSDASELVQHCPVDSSQKWLNTHCISATSVFKLLDLLNCLKNNEK